MRPSTLKKWTRGHNAFHSQLVEKTIKKGMQIKSQFIDIGAMHPKQLGGIVIQNVAIG